MNLAIKVIGVDDGKGSVTGFGHNTDGAVPQGFGVRGLYNHLERM